LFPNSIESVFRSIGDGRAGKRKPWAGKKKVNDLESVLCQQKKSPHAPRRERERKNCLDVVLENQSLHRTRRTASKKE